MDKKIDGLTYAELGKVERFLDTQLNTMLGMGTDMDKVLYRALNELYIQVANTINWMDGES